MRPAEDALGCKVPRIYCSLGECGKVYVKQMDHSTKTRCKEHTIHICTYHADKLVVTKHSISEGHYINYKGTIVLARTAG